MKTGKVLTTGGWTLVELLVGVTLSLVVIAGIGQIYLAAKRSYEVQESMSRLQDVGRYATEVLTRDIHNAGYWGLMDPATATISNAVSPSATCSSASTNWGKMITEKIFGFDHTEDMSGYACISPSNGDVLTVRYGDPSTVTPYSGSALYIRTTRDTGTVAIGPAGAAGAMTSDHELKSFVYYLTNSTTARECGKTSAPSPFLPALAREALIISGANVGKPKKEELVTGVEEMQLQYGADTDGDASIDRYLDADEVLDWGQIRAVRFWILVRDDCPDPSYTDSSSYDIGNLPSFSPGDHFRRALYTSTVALRN